MMWWNHGFGWGWPVFLVMALVFVAMMAVMMRHGTSMMRHGTSGGTRPASDRDENTPERILARRLASGEIDVQEYERLREALQRTSNSTADTAEPSHAERHSPEA